ARRPAVGRWLRHGGTGGEGYRRQANDKCKSHDATSNELLVPLTLSVVVIRNRPPPRSMMSITKLPVSTVPGCRPMPGPEIADEALEARRFKMLRSSVSLNCCKGVLGSMPARAAPVLGSVCLFCA